MGAGALALEFELQLARTEGGLSVAVVNSPRGQSEHVAVALGDVGQQLARLTGEIERAAALTRSGVIASPPAEELGRRLYEVMFPAGKVRELFVGSLALAEANHTHLRVRVRGAHETIAAFPWECAYDPVRREHPFRRSQTPLVRSLEVAAPVVPLRVDGPLHVLFVASRPVNRRDLDLGAEYTQLEKSLKPLAQRGLVRLTPVEATVDAVHGAVRAQPAHVFHFSGHGAEGVLDFEQPDSRLAYPLEAQALAEILREAPGLRLVFLNACEGARSLTTANSVASALVNRGITAVVAMQFVISNQAAGLFASTFYECLASGDAVDVAVTRARLRMHALRSIEWATPVLYLRSGDAYLFERTPPRPARIKAGVLWKRTRARAVSAATAVTTSLWRFGRTAARVVTTSLWRFGRTAARVVTTSLLRFGRRAGRVVATGLAGTFAAVVGFMLAMAVPAMRDDAGDRSDSGNLSEGRDEDERVGAAGPVVAPAPLPPNGRLHLKLTDAPPGTFCRSATLEGSDHGSVSLADAVWGPEGEEVPSGTYRLVLKECGGNAMGRNVTVESGVFTTFAIPWARQ